MKKKNFINLNKTVVQKYGTLLYDNDSEDFIKQNVIVMDTNTSHYLTG